MFTADIQIALGGGYGRVVDVGAAIRVRRLARMLDDARALGKPIDAATSKKLQLTWWALRGERSDYRALIATVAILREAGILLGEPNAAITYEILQVLRDTQLYMRPERLRRAARRSARAISSAHRHDGNCDAICGRVEQVIATRRLRRAAATRTRSSSSGNAYARYRLFAGDGEPSPWARRRDRAACAASRTASTANRSARSTSRGELPSRTTAR